ncbi:uncharacterized protein LACBIDRAFT_335069 [Laccaria bicolor S238N-H82]|uniref:Predicted protein n=1 Tax=Laccaria bicolor (strain S238N-H82 / ATCC MYA-4686) TaxID=486041 RepID=B0E192_LACBS|nr:uncharacterized protein LACBIDRAFT_335069 [Laccaria bicolor S238N-H82]EDQ99421.1 predicted protein [Laccaria bicolor S238N-H82]|eukprot:XP_001889972.1 predicted protein [Laccaria bicolor S238N-H82]
MAVDFQLPWCMPPVSVQDNSGPKVPFWTINVAQNVMSGQIPLEESVEIHGSPDDGVKPSMFSLYLGCLHGVVAGVSSKTWFLSLLLSPMSHVRHCHNTTLRIACARWNLQYMLSQPPILMDAPGLGERTRAFAFNASNASDLSSPARDAGQGFNIMEGLSAGRKWAYSSGAHEITDTITEPTKKVFHDSKIMHKIVLVGSFTYMLPSTPTVSSMPLPPTRMSTRITITYNKGHLDKGTQNGGESSVRGHCCKHVVISPTSESPCYCG